MPRSSFSVYRPDPDQRIDHPSEPEPAVAAAQPPPLPSEKKAAEERIVTLAVVNLVLACAAFVLLRFLVPILATAAAVKFGVVKFTWHAQLVIDIGAHVRKWGALAVAPWMAAVAAGCYVARRTGGPTPVILGLRTVLFLQILALLGAAVSIGLTLQQLGSKA